MVGLRDEGSGIVDVAGPPFCGTRLTGRGVLIVYGGNLGGFYVLETNHDFRNAVLEAVGDFMRNEFLFETAEIIVSGILE